MKLILRPWLFLIIFIVTLFWPVLFANKTFFFGDNFNLMVPGKVFTANVIKQERIIPFWLPYNFAGVPYLADINQSLFYPSTLLFILFNPATATNINVLLHLFIGAFGVYKILELKTKSDLFAVMGGVLWVVSEPVLGWISSFTFLQTASWIPWLFYFALRQKRPGLSYAPLISISLLGGHPQPLTYALVVIGLYLCINKQWSRLRDFLISGLFSGIMTLFVLVPFYEFSSNSTRNLASVSEKVAGSLSISHLIHFVVPNFFSNPQIGMAWGPDWDRIKMVTGYLSWAGLLVVYVSIRNFKSLDKDDKFFLCLLIGSLIFSLIGNSIFLSKIIYLIPLINNFRNPSAVLFLYVLSVIYLLPNLFRWNFYPKFKIALIGIFAITLMSIVGIFLWNFFGSSFWIWIDSVFMNALSQSNIHTFERDNIIITNALIQVTVSSLLFITFILTIKYKPAAAAFFIVLDVWLANKNIVFYAPSSIYENHSAQANFLKETQSNNYRVVSTSSYLPYLSIDDYWKNMYIKPPFGDSIYTGSEPTEHVILKNRQSNLNVNWNQVEKISTIDGYATLLLQESYNYWKSGYQNYTSINYLPRVAFTDPRLNDTSVRYVLVDKTVFPGRKIPEVLNQFNPVKETANWIILENTKALPIVRFENNHKGTIRMHSSNVNQILFTTESKQQSQILIKVPYYPGWKCSINSNPCQIKAENFGMMIVVPAGLHKVRLNFTPSGWPYLAYISLIGWSVCFSILGKSFVNFQNLSTKNRREMGRI